MGLLLSILFSYVGAVELMYVVRDIVHQIGSHHELMELNRDSSKSTSSSSSLLDLQEHLRKSIKSAQIRLCETESIHSMADGVQYEEGYRIFNDDEPDISSRWLEARANTTIEPSHIISANNVENNYVIANSDQIRAIDDDDDDYQSDDTLRNDSLRSSSSLSAETVVENRKIDELIDNDESNDANHLNGNGEDVPNIHFDEYSLDHLHALDGITKKGQRKNDEARRRKSYKVFSSGHPSDAFQRRRSEDVDGETDNPWGLLKPETFHDETLWTRERAMSIAENEEMMAFFDGKSYQENFKRETKPLNSTSSTTNDNDDDSGNSNSNGGDTDTNNNKSSAFDEEKNDPASESHEAQKSDVSNETQCILADSFEEVDASSGGIEKMRSLPEILVDGSDMDEIVEDGKIGAFMDYIGRMDTTQITADKLQFREYLEQPKRKRYSSYNYETDKDNEDELKDFSIVESDEQESGVSANNDENKSSDLNRKRAINNRKPNMFALAAPQPFSNGNETEIENDNPYSYRPLIRITPTEDERIEQFLHENCEQINKPNRSSGEILIKSKTTQMFDCDDENVSDADSLESDSPGANSPSYDGMRRDSALSDIGSEPIQFECKQSDQPNYIYNRADSTSSHKSNVLFERSQSRFSELEYIKGRDDWKDDYTRSDISEEIDSDNYHHSRRHSEAADTLEYIRGREDWLRNELNRTRRNSLPRIFEVGEPKMLIQDEIDSDEYHHNFFENETMRSSSETTNKTRNKLIKQDAHIDDIDGQFVRESLDNVNNTDSIDIVSNDNKRTSQWPNQSMVESNNETTMVTSTNALFDKSNEINEVIENLITHEAAHTEDIEITVFDLTPEQQKNNPFVVISEATDDNRDITNEQNLNQSSGLVNSQPIEISISECERHKDGRGFTENSETKSNELHFKQNNSGTFLLAEIQNESNNRNQNHNQQEKEIELEQKYGTTQQNNRNNRAKSERLDIMTTNLLKPSEQKPRRSLSFENVEDLIRDVANGPWFHK